MSGATAGSDRWDEASTGDDDATEPVPVEPPLDNRTTQPMPRIERPGTSAAPASPASSSPDTVRVEAPAWFLRVQKRAAEQNRARDAPDADASAGGDATAHASTDHEAAAPFDRDAPDRDGEGEAPSVTAIDPSSVRHDLDDAPSAAAEPKQASHSGRGDGRRRFLDPAVAASYREPAPPPDLVAGTIGILGAAMLVVGSFMTWGRSTGVVEATVTGLSGSNGWGTLACGLVVAFGAVLVLAGRRRGLVGGSMLIAALAAVYFCGFSAVDILRTGDELPEILVGAGVDRAAAEVATLQLTSGFAVVAAGAAAALAAGTIAFARRV